MSTADSVRGTVEPVVVRAGFDLDDLTVTQAGRRRLVRVVLDADGGVDLDAAADVSRRISAELDESGAMGETPYVLEVGSRGVDRPLTLPRHWRRNVGRLVRVQPEDGEPFVGRIVGPVADDAEAVSLQVESADAPITLPLASIVRAVVQVEFSRASADDDGPDPDPDDAGGAG